ncbi:MAG: AAA family ATPase [Armatimonadota bacterium]|nr:AAA family ATPase [Armatimonadota bacterium]
MDASQRIDVLIRARYSILYVVSWEEERVEKALKSIAGKRDKQMFTWTITRGMVQEGGKQSDPSTTDPLRALDFAMEHKDPALFVLRDFDPFLDDPTVERKLRDVARAFRASYKTLIIVSPVLEIPNHLEKDVTVIDFPLPDQEELQKLLAGIVKQVEGNPNIRIQLDEEGREQLVKAGLGLTASEAEDAFAKAVVLNARLGPEDIEVVLTEKEQIIRKSGILQFYSAEERFGHIGGLDSLKQWLGKRGKAFTEAARKFGLPQPKGVLLIGVQGCGKSLSAKAVSSLWRLPLLRLDVGSVFSGVVGSSEQNMRRAMRLSESIAPCILWLDELEKGFSGTQSSSFSDAGTTARVFGSFITWLQEKTEPVFVIATANDITALPPELMRKGRFDEIFFIDLPSESEREEIFRIHLEKRDRDPSKFDIAQLAQASEGFSGSEIEQVVISGLYDAFDEQRELTTQHMLSSIESTVPLSDTRREDIDALRSWAETRARPASVHAAATTAERRRFEF